MSISRRHVLFSILRGLLLSVGITLTGMLLIAALAVLIRIPDNLLTAINQILKITAILLGVCAAVGRGGSRGFAAGAALALLYSALGYGMYTLLGGASCSASQMLGELLLGSVIGALGGAILVNLPARKRRRRAS